MEAAFKDDEEAQVVRVVQVELLKEESAEQETFCYNTVPLILWRIWSLMEFLIRILFYPFSYNRAKLYQGI